MSLCIYLPGSVIMLTPKSNWQQYKVVSAATMHVVQIKGLEGRLTLETYSSPKSGTVKKHDTPHWTQKLYHRQKPHNTVSPSTSITWAVTSGTSIYHHSKQHHLEVTPDSSTTTSRLQTWLSSNCFCAVSSLHCSSFWLRRCTWSSSWCSLSLSSFCFFSLTISSFRFNTACYKQRADRQPVSQFQVSILMVAQCHQHPSCRRNVSNLSEVLWHFNAIRGTLGQRSTLGSCVNWSTT